MRIARTVENLSEKVAIWSMNHTWYALLACIVIAFTGALGGVKLEFSGDYQVFFSDKNPQLQTFLDFEATYGKADNISFVLIPKEGDIYRPDVIDAIHEITTQAWNIPSASRVDSLTNFQHTIAVGDELIVEHLVYDPEEVRSMERLNEIREIVKKEPLLNKYVVSEKGDATIVNVILQADRHNAALVKKTILKAREIRNVAQNAYPEIEIKLTGLSMLSAAFSEVALLDAQTLIPGMYLLIISVMLIVIRSVYATIAALLLVGLSTIFAMGIGGWLGVELTPISVTAPTIILTIAVADAIHIIVALQKKMLLGESKDKAILEAVVGNAFPITITSITTIVGFISLNFSDSPPFHHLGNITAAGILMAWVLSLVFLPALIQLMPIGCKNHAIPLHRTSKMYCFGRWVLSNKYPVFIATMLSTALVITMIPRIEFNDVWSKYFDTSVSIRQAIDTTQPYFGTDSIEFIIDTGKPNNVLNPELLQDISEFTKWFEAREEVRHVYSVSHIMKRLNKNLNGDDPDFYTIPDNQKKASQYLLVYELSLPYGLDLNDRIDITRQKTRISVTVKDMSTASTRAFENDAIMWFNTHSKTKSEILATGATPLFNYIADRNVSSMINGLGILIVVIFVIMAASFRSVGIGVISVLLNALPILATFGLWALLVGEVGFSISIVGAVAMGLVIDDSVHILSKYVRARYENSKDFEDSMLYAYETSGVAILSTTLILGAGFALLTSSSFKPNTDLGLMTAIAIFMAMIVNFLALPTLLSFMNSYIGKRT